MSKEPVGTVGEEAAKLFAVLQQASADARGENHHHDHAHAAAAGDKAGDKAGDEAGTSGGRAAECQWCPVCQLVSRVRQANPETVEQLATAAAVVLGSVRSLLEAAAEAARQARAESAGPAEDEPSRSKVDRIDVSEDPEPWD